MYEIFAQREVTKVVRIAGQKSPAAHLRMRTDPEVSKHPFASPPSGTITSVSLCGPPGDILVKRIKVPPDKLSIQIPLAAASHSSLSVDDRIVSQCIEGTKVRQLSQRPIEPFGISGGEIQQDARIDQRHS